MSEYKTFSFETKINESHLDTFGHVNNAKYLEILEQARWEMLTESGFGLEQIQESQIGPIILEIQIRYKRELKNRQKVRIETQVQKFESKILTLRQQIFNLDSENRLSASATIVFGLFDMKKRKLIVPTPEWLSGVGV